MVWRERARAGVQARFAKDGGIACRVNDALRSLAAEGTYPSFYLVARRAGVARSTLYRREDLRAAVDRARARARSTASKPTASRANPSVALLQEELRRAWGRIEELEAERRRLFALVEEGEVCSYAVVAGGLPVERAFRLPQIRSWDAGDGVHWPSA